MENNIYLMVSEIRTSTRWPESRIAKKLGVSQPTVNRILNGQENCKASTFQAIAGLYSNVKSMKGMN